MSTFGLWDEMSNQYGGASAPQASAPWLMGYVPGQSSSPAPQAAPAQPQQAPSSALATLNPPAAAPSSAPGVSGGGGGGASPNYLGLARQGASLANGISGGGSGSALGDLGAGLGMYQGIASGTPQGYAGAAVGGAKLANNLGAFGDSSGAASAGLSGAGGALGLYGGLKEGGIGGDTQAGLGAAQMAAPIASAAGAAGLGTALAAAGPLSMALAPALLGASKPAVQLDASYWNRVQNGLQSAIASGDKGQIASNVMGLLNQPQGQIPSQIQQLVYQTGMVPGSGWGLQYTPNQFQDASQILQQTGNKGPTGHQANRAARGGSMKADPKVLKARLRKLYEGSFANRKRHFSDGGSYINYTGYTNPYSTYSPAPPPVDYSSVTLPTDQAGLQQALQNNTPAYDANGNPVNENSNPVPSGLQENSNSAFQLPSSIPGLGSTSGSGGGSGGALGGSSVGQLVQQYGALAPLLSALLGGNKPASAPATPAGYGSIPSIATPTNNRSYTQPNVANWYTYGQGPEQSFFSNNQLPTVPGVSPGTGAATPTPATGANTLPPQGGAPAMSTIQPVTAPRPQLQARGGTFDSQQGDSYVPDPGAGDGTSDDVDAKLSGGEYVMDAGTVSTLGNGSNEAGARALDQLRARVRKHAGKQLVKGKQFMKAKPPAAYLGGKS